MAVAKVDRQQQTLYMGRALLLAGRGAGDVSPNPMVGAVLVRGGEVVGEGYHRSFGSRHAEVVALRAAGAKARGATLYTNLEPCAHHGKTPPCVDALLAAGVRRVVAAMRDPDPKVRGRGFRALRRGDVKVEVGLLAREASRLNEAFLHRVTSGRPLVTLKAGTSLDGRIAAAGGRSQWITGPVARERTHRLRRIADAVLVGVGTVLADDPRLTARPRGVSARRQPLRIVLDSRYRTPPKGRLLREKGGGPVIIYGLDCQVQRRRRLGQAGAETVVVRANGGRPDLVAVLADLAARGAQSTLVEGGSEVNWSFLKAGLADRLAWFIAPCLLGGGGVPVLAGPGVAEPKRAFQVADLTVSRCGPDLLVQGRPVQVRSRGGRRTNVHGHRQ